MLDGTLTTEKSLWFLVLLELKVLVGCLVLLDFDLGSKILILATVVEVKPVLFGCQVGEHKHAIVHFVGREHTQQEATKVTGNLSGRTSSAILKMYVFIL